MFAPKPFDVAKEMVRVTRPGGRIVMGNWIPNDPTLVAQILKISSNYTPPPPEGFVSPMTWGVESNVIERFTAAGIPKDNISFARDTFTFNFPGTPSQFVDVFRKYYGPTMNAFEAAEKQGRAAELQKQLEELFNSQNKSQEGTSIPATFLRVTVEQFERGDYGSRTDPAFDRRSQEITSSVPFLLRLSCLAVSCLALSLGRRAISSASLLRMFLLRRPFSAADAVPPFGG